MNQNLAITIEHVTPADFAAKKADLAKEANITSTVSESGAVTGTINGHGVTASYSYDPQTEVLSVQIVRKPFYIPMGAIQQQILDAFAPAPKAA